MATRPLVSVYNQQNEAIASKSVHLPAIFRAPIRPDIVSFVHDKMMKNTRQPYCVSWTNDPASNIINELNLYPKKTLSKAMFRIIYISQNYPLWSIEFAITMKDEAEMKDAPFFTGEQQSGSSNICRFLGNRSRRGPYSSRQGWWHSPIWSGCLWQHVQKRPDVCAHQNVEKMASQDQHQSKKIRHVLGHCCYWSARSSYVQGP